MLISPEMWIFTYCYWSWSMENGVSYNNDLPAWFDDAVDINSLM